MMQREIQQMWNTLPTSKFDISKATKSHAEKTWRYAFQEYEEEKKIILPKSHPDSFRKVLDWIEQKYGYGK